MTPPYRSEQQRIYLNGVRGTKPRVPVDMERLAYAAARRLSPAAFAYIAGGAGSESTVRANRAAFEHWRIVPRMLRDVSVADTTIQLLGHTYLTPLLLAPIGVLELAHHQADLAVARAAASLQVPMIFSNQASQSMEDCAAVMDASPRWFQLYWSTSDELVISLVRRAEAAGCEALVVTLDTTMLGWRTRDLDQAYLPFLRGKGLAQYLSDPVFLANLPQQAADALGATSVNFAALKVLFELTKAFPGNFWHNLLSKQPRIAVQQFVRTYSRPSLTWEDLHVLRQYTHLPILLKGILDPADAQRAIAAGMDGVIVSNHGGRQVDGAIGALDALPAIIAAVNEAIPVVFDSGIRWGADIFKALALGATAVAVGRPYVYGLALAGEQGVQAVLRHLLADFELTMGLAGCRSIAEITSDRLVHTTG